MGQDPALCRISPVDPDWVEKGCHLHVGRVEVALRPDHQRGVVVRKVFSSTTDGDLDVATRVVLNAIEDPAFRNKLIRVVERAMTFCAGVEGEPLPRARGRLRELRMVVIALQRKG